MAMTAEQLREFIRERLPCEHIEVSGDGRHFAAVIVSPEFREKTLVQRHQLVYSVLGDKMKREVHALSMKTLTPEDWSNSKEVSPELSGKDVKKYKCS